MISVLILNFLTLSFVTLSFAALGASPASSARQSVHSAPATKTSTASDPYAPLRLYDGKWDLLQPTGVKAADPVHIENQCAKVGEFFACNQFVNGKNIALVIMLPAHALENGGYAYRNQALRVEGENPGAWGSLEIVGDRWIYSSDEIDKGKTVYWRTTNVFSGTDKIHFEVQRSGDGVEWTTTTSGDEVRAK